MALKSPAMAALGSFMATGAAADMVVINGRYIVPTTVSWAAIIF